MADAARWVSLTAPPPLVQLVATDPVAGETGKTAKVTFARPADQADVSLTVRYQLGGTASNGVDIAAQPGTVTFAPGAAFTNLVIRAVDDETAEGDKLLTLTLQPDASYRVGPLSNCVVRILDKPFDAWRFLFFTAPELLDPAISGPEADPDGDGVSNTEEFRGGTDPRDSRSVLKVHIEARDHAVRLGFPAGSNRAYVLEYRQDFNAGPGRTDQSRLSGHQSLVPLRGPFAPRRHQPLLPPPRPVRAAHIHSIIQRPPLRRFPQPHQPAAPQD